MSHRLHSNARTTPQTRAEISQSTFSTQEWIVCELRRMLWLPIDDLVAVTKEFINPVVQTCV